MTSHADLVDSNPTQLPPKDLVDHSAVFIVYLEVHVSTLITQPFFQSTVHVGRHMQFMHAWSGNQYSTDLVGWRHVIQHDYLHFLFLLHFLLLTLGAHAQRGLQYLVCVCVCVCYSTSHFSRVYSCHKRY